VGEVDEALAEWWQDFQSASDDRREDLMDQAREEQKVRQKAQPVVKRVPRAASAAGAAPHDTAAGKAALPDDAAPLADGEAPKKRRRRRRKPGGGSGEGAASAAAGE
jgi:poly(A) polymerase